MSDQVADSVCCVAACNVIGCVRFASSSYCLLHFCCEHLGDDGSIEGTGKVTDEARLKAELPAVQSRVAVRPTSAPSLSLKVAAWVVVAHQVLLPRR